MSEVLEMLLCMMVLSGSRSSVAVSGDRELTSAWLRLYDYVVWECRWPNGLWADEERAN